MIPALAGLGAPHWRAEARALICGMSFATTKAHIVRAALEAQAHQAHDLMEAFAADGVRWEKLRIDGGMAANSWLCQFLADILQLPVERPQYLETTALGAAFLAGLEAAVWSGLDELGSIRSRSDRFNPAMEEARRKRLIAGWQAAVRKTLTI